MDRKYLLLVFCLCFSVMGFAQTQNRFAGWFSSLNSIHIKNKWGWQLDVNLRSTDEWKYTQTFMVRNSLSYRINKVVTVFAGYTHTQSRVTINNVSGYTGEHQIFEQAFIRHRLGLLYTLHRPLFEQRFMSKNVIKGNDVVTDGRDFVLRGRYLFRNVLPFANKKTFEKGAYAYAQEEILLILSNNKAINGKTYDQLRLQAGLGYRFSPKVDVESGYLFREQTTKTDLKYHDHIVQLTVFLRL